MVAEETLDDPVDGDRRRRSSSVGRTTARHRGAARASTASGSSCQGHPEQRFIGLGARHGLHVDQAGRRLQLGADRAYTGPDCPPDMLDVGGIPQGDYAPVPWVICPAAAGRPGSRTTATACASTLGDEVVLSTRAAAGPLQVHLFTHPTPARAAARVPAAHRAPAACCRSGPTGSGRAATSTATSATPRPIARRLSASTASRSTRSCSTPRGRRNTTRGSSTRTSSRTRAGTSRALREDGVRTVVWVAPWVNLDSREGQYPPDDESARLHRRAGAELRAGALRARRRRAARRALVDGHGLAGRLHQRRRAEEWWREQAKRVLALGVEGIKADDGEGWYLPDEVRFADGTTGAQSAWGHGLCTGARCSARSTRCIRRRACCSAARAGRASRPSGITWGGDQPSDFWSLRTLVAATLTAAASGSRNWSHDIGGYLGEKLVSRARRSCSRAGCSSAASRR